MRRRSFPVGAMVIAAMLVSVADARADWLITPFLGATFGSSTTFVDLEASAGTTQVVFGGSGAWLARDRILGVEAEFSYGPHFFETDNRGGLVLGSSLATFTGSLLAAAPLSLTRESLRPYLVAGAGVIHASIDDVRGLVAVHDGLAGMSLGGGVIGFVGQRTGLRFDLRQFRALSRSDDPVTLVRGNRLTFWRASAGVTLRY